MDSQPQRVPCAEKLPGKEEEMNTNECAEDYHLGMFKEDLTRLCLYTRRLCEAQSFFDEPNLVAWRKKLLAQTRARLLAAHCKALEASGIDTSEAHIMDCTELSHYEIGQIVKVRDTNKIGVVTKSEGDGMYLVKDAEGETMGMLMADFDLERVSVVEATGANK